MIRSIFQSFTTKRMCQLVISRQLLRSQHSRSPLIHACSSLTPSSTTPQLSLTIRTMSSDVNRNLSYTDILELAKKKDEQTKERIVLIDVREPDEIKETGLIPGFVHIPLGDVPNALKASPENFKEKYGIEKPDQDAALVFSCRSGKRSQKALTTALEQGYTKSKHYAGGWLDWESKTKK